MTDASKAPVWTALYTPWGAPHSITGSETLNARFPGQWFQLEAGLAYNWHRHYDPSLGRYTQPDPLGFVDGPSVFAYAKSSPHRYVDTDGQQVVAIPHPIGIPIAIAALYCAAYPEKCKKLVDQCIALFKLPAKDDPDRCKKIVRMCSEKCKDIYSDRPWELPGEGTDMPGRLRRCIRECAEAHGCHNF